jgi:hypothetical protein
MIYDLRRARGLLTALSAVSAVMMAYSLILHATLGRAETWLHDQGQAFMVPNSIEVGARRVLGIRRERESGLVDSKSHLGLLIGPSVLQQGIDPAVLTTELGEDYRWANLRCSAPAHENNLLTQVIYQSGLRPDALIVVCNPGILVADRDTRADRPRPDLASLRDHLVHRQLERVRADLIDLTFVPWNLAFPSRGQVFTLVDRFLFLTKLRMFQSRGWGLESLYAPDTRPWVEDYPASAPADDEVNRNIMQFIGIKGWLDPTQYRSDGTSFALLRELFEITQAHGTRSFILLVPESSAYRAKLPANRAEHLMTTLPRLLGDAAPVILDYREVAPDADFININHLSPQGRINLTKRLARDLKAYLKKSDESQAR